MTVEVPDLRGDFVQVGDTIAYAATDGRSSGLRIGKVVEIVEAHERFETYDHGCEYGTQVPVKVRVQVEYTTGYMNMERPVLIDPSFKRFVKVGP